MFVPSVASQSDSYAPPLADDLKSTQREPQTVDAHALIAEVVREHRAIIQSKKLRVNLRLLSRHSTFARSPERLRQVYTCLVRTAVAAARPGGMLTLHTSSPGDGTLRLEIDETSAWRGNAWADRMAPSDIAGSRPSGLH